MTGFGRAQATQNGYAVQVDLRSLNHRFLEVRVRGLADLPLLVQRCEERLRDQFARGALELYVKWEHQGEARPKHLELAAARRYLADLTRLGEELGLADPPRLDHLLQLGAFQERPPHEEELWPALAAALDQAIHAVHAARAEEGEHLRAALAREAGLLHRLTEDAQRLAAESLREAEDRLRQRLAQLKVEADPTRVATELVLWAERSDVREELDRLQAHLRRLSELLDLDRPVGRELEFLAQEIGREATTLAAKARSAGLSQVALEMHLAVERIRQQARNVE
ncbi:MAG: YicC family protein [Candidatus Acetothermia bacterium]|jgi:uncharacterized protein (TIGR00255 family)|nr:YicC family protein [Candidatus Acetothermia bacterium]